MQNQPKPGRVPSNPIHRRQAFWQIWIPLGIVILLVLTAAVLAAVFTGGGQISSGQLASVSIIWLILPLIVAGFIYLLFIAGMIFFIARAARLLPVYTHLIQLYAHIINLRVTEFLDRLVNPVIRGRARASGWKAIWKKAGRA